MSDRTKKTCGNGRRRGFTLIELLVGGTIMLIVIVGALAVYSKSNRVSVDQSQYAELQNEVRSAMYLVIRDARMAGSGLPESFGAYALQGTDNEDQGATVKPDRLKLMGNMTVPLVLGISSYQGNSVTLNLDDYSFESYSYSDSFYANMYCLVLPNPDSGCTAAEVRVITHVTHDSVGTNEKFNFSPGLAAGIDPPNGFSGTCTSSSNYDGGTIMFVDLVEYWLDVTGNYSGLTAGTNGYIGGGVGGVLYMTKNGVNYPLAQNIENFQVQYNGDFDNDGVLDGFADWNSSWSVGEIGRIRQIRLIILGRTPSAFTTMSGTGPSGLYIFRRPAMANSAAATSDDMHRRFLVESTANIRNLSLNLYNEGVR